MGKLCQIVVQRLLRVGTLAARLGLLHGLLKLCLLLVLVASLDFVLLGLGLVLEVFDLRIDVGAAVLQLKQTQALLVLGL